MGIGGALRELGQYLEECERQRNVDSVDLNAEGKRDAPGRVTADIELTMSAPDSATEEGDTSLAATGVDDDGTVRVTLETEAALPERRCDVDLEPADVSLNADGTISVGVTASTPVSEDGGSAGAADGPETDTASSEGRPPTDAVTDGEPPERPVDVDGGDRDVPPFEDTELLRDIYESYNTFAEMQEALDMDITAETVRRYMIGHGIHDPNSYDTDEDGESDDDGGTTGGDVDTREPGDDAGAVGSDDPVGSPAVVADGIGLPENVTVETLVDAVRRSDTLYQVKREMDVDRDEALELLRRTGLVDHVVGRLATKHEREVSREMVIERLRENAEPT